MKDLLGIFRDSFRTMAVALRACFWTAQTLWLGASGLWRVGRLVRERRQLVAETLTCPRRHEVPAYSLWTCSSCGSLFEGYAFQPCPVCSRRASVVACDECGLAIRDPLR